MLSLSDWPQKKGTLMKKNNALLKLAEETNDLQLYKVATGEIDKLSFLIEFVKKNDLGSLVVCGDTLESVLHANKARYKKVASWLLCDTDDMYKELHQRELDLLDEYADVMLSEIFAQLDDLKVKAAEDAAAAEKAAAEKAAKRAERAAKKAAREAEE